MTLIRELIPIPERVHQGDFVLKLSGGVRDADETLPSCTTAKPACASAPNGSAPGTCSTGKIRSTPRQATNRNVGGARPPRSATFRCRPNIVMPHRATLRRRCAQVPRHGSSRTPCSASPESRGRGSGCRGSRSSALPCGRNARTPSLR